MIHVWIINFKCFYVKSEYREKCDAFYFHKGKKHCTNSKKTCAIYRYDAIAEKTVCKLFVRFRS